MATAIAIALSKIRPRTTYLGPYATAFDENDHVTKTTRSGWSAGMTIVSRDGVSKYQVDLNGALRRLR